MRGKPFGFTSHKQDSDTGCGASAQRSGTRTQLGTGVTHPEVRFSVGELSDCAQLLWHVPSAVGVPPTQFPDAQLAFELQKPP